jgi:hypothetical protein
MEIDKFKAPAIVRIVGAFVLEKRRIRYKQTPFLAIKDLKF